MTDHMKATADTASTVTVSASTETTSTAPPTPPKKGHAGTKISYHNE